MYFDYFLYFIGSTRDTIYRLPPNAKKNGHKPVFFCERDSSGTTEANDCEAGRREGDGADSPTRAPKGREAARPILMC
jgi:hypothetical protein